MGSLVVNQKDSLYGGINRQAAEHRLPVQVEESINAYPTVNTGLLKRNPTKMLALDDSIDYNKILVDIYLNDYLICNDYEKYSFTENTGCFEYIDDLSMDFFESTEYSYEVVIEFYKYGEYVTTKTISGNNVVVLGEGR